MRSTFANDTGSQRVARQPTSWLPSSNIGAAAHAAAPCAHHAALLAFRRSSTGSHYPAQQLGKATDMLKLTQTGVADIGYVAPAYASDKMPVSEVAILPGHSSIPARVPSPIRTSPRSACCNPSNTRRKAHSASPAHRRPGARRRHQSGNIPRASANTARKFCAKPGFRIRRSMRLSQKAG
jgi:hypothetical protein